MTHPVTRAAAPAAALATRVQPTRAMATASILAAGAVTAASLGATITAFSAQTTIEQVLVGATAPQVVAYDVFSWVFSGLAVVAWVMTSVWLSRARANSERITTLRHERGAVWCWLSWIVPVVSLWFPRQVVRDIHRASSGEFAVPRGLDLWWWLWLAGAFTSQVADRVAPGETFEHVSWLGPLNALSTALLVGAFSAWVRIITDLVRLQDSRAAG